MRISFNNARWTQILYLQHIKWEKEHFYNIIEKMPRDKYIIYLDIKYSLSLNKNLNFSQLRLFNFNLIWFVKTF